jgi:thiamine biosynthesis lipoprotein
VKARLPLVDYRQVFVDRAAGTVRLGRAGMRLGLGGLAKGLALSLAGARLRQAGFASFALSAGGQVLAVGRKNARAWRIGVRDPRGAAADYFALVEIADQSVSTTGDYERFFEHEGKRYCHVLDPKTGWPAQLLRSATVVAPNPMRADALATALMVLWPLALAWRPRSSTPPARSTARRA